MNTSPKEEDIKKEIEDLSIIKELVVGFLIVKTKAKDGIYFINTIPLDISWDRFDGDNDIDQNEEIIGIIPAQPFSYKVLGLFPRDNKVDSGIGFDMGFYDTLGYEYNGVYHPDWNELLAERIKNKDYRKKKI